MQVTINGETRDVPSDLTVEELLREIGTKQERVAVELNLEVVPRAEFGERRVRDGDSLEVVHFVGGG